MPQARLYMDLVVVQSSWVFRQVVHRTLSFSFFVCVANLDASVVARLPNTIANGIYFGWARVEGYPVCKTVVSIGWNPFFRNTTRSVVSLDQGSIQSQMS
ncbi:riboflavin kinase [Clonorchis sinensis]|uniref:riboflavin kinase n=1 Tax=Clonorchis sinensis TaxID=79923 RepID=G7YWS4_CLOSI|nr:riboflavin kinase [Clonorchis sinensis]